MLWLLEASHQRLRTSGKAPSCKPQTCWHKRVIVFELINFSRGLQQSFLIFYIMFCRPWLISDLWLVGWWDAMQSHLCAESAKTRHALPAPQKSKNRYKLSSIFSNYQPWPAMAALRTAARTFFKAVWISSVYDCLCNRCLTLLVRLLHICGIPLQQIGYPAFICSDHNYSL